MGLAPIWRLRTAAADAVEDSAGTAPGGEAVSVAADTSGAIDVPPPMSAMAPSTAPESRAARPVVPGADRVPVARTPTNPPVVAAPLSGGDAGRAGRIARMDWDALEADIRACGACRLCEKRRQAVPGVGDRHADWMFVGEGPGSEEDLRGEPFVGAAGRLLDAMLAAIGLKRGENVYIANAVKCRPPHNRTPQADEIATCHPYLARQIALVQPRVLIALGRPAALALLDAEISIGASRGRIFQRGETPVVVTYHPAYLLRNQADKAKAWEDLCFARRVMRDAGGMV
ncbi:uracil-DNA glycosylase family protein [Azoarcus sp. DN11]|uniref:uracil-DNA glycosylase family protein n=1 Tax=Azoarcus sp. DN11 TaxID=356837 RepID=UPI000EAE1285|nr:uracil-DNA glycosylase family protein [Azoarcus sp. DN11]AYH44234.1 DNA polymerase III [Azoarcus sp. DN11]